jgi:cytochrome P450
MSTTAPETAKPLNRSELFRTSNAELLARWPIDVNQDPWSIPLDAYNPGHPDLFEFRKELPYFERLRKEDPVHYTANSQFGPYWSVTRYDDIMHVDKHHELFSSDSRRGGISLGGVADPDPDPNFALPMFNARWLHRSSRLATSWPSSR